jgi:hypothetical protein
LQSRAGGNALIGRALYPLLVKAGYNDVGVSPRMVYVDFRKQKLELTWIGKENRPKLEPRILLEALAERFGKHETKRKMDR